MRIDTRQLQLLVLGAVGVYLALMVAIAAFVVHPPLLGWIGLALVAAIATLAAALALAFFSRLRTNARRLHPHEGTVHRLLVVTGADAEPGEINSAVQRRTIGRPAQVHVVAPVVASTLHFLTEDEERETFVATQRLRSALAALTGAGITARGIVGTDDPLQAVGDVLAEFPADEILLVGSWLEPDFERRVRDLFGVPVSAAPLSRLESSA